MDINDIRETFDKATLVMCDRGIIVSYSNNELPIDVDFFDENMECIKALANSCDCISFSQKKGMPFKIEFLTKLEGQDAIIYKPLNSFLSIAEMRDLLEESKKYNKDKRKEFADFFNDTNLSDESQVFQKLLEYIELHEPKSEATVFEKRLQNKNFNEFKKSIMQFINILSVDFDIIEPDGDHKGSVDVHFSGKIRLNGKYKNIFCEALEYCSGIEFEASGSSGSATIIFYPY